MKLKLKQDVRWKDKGYSISYSMCEVFSILFYFICITCYTCINKYGRYYAVETVKARKQGNGTIILVPKVPDIFENVEPNEYFDADTDNLVKDVQLRGAELSD